MTLIARETKAFSQPHSLVIRAAALLSFGGFSFVEENMNGHGGGCFRLQTPQLTQYDIPTSSNADKNSTVQVYVTAAIATEKNLTNFIKLSAAKRVEIQAQFEQLRSAVNSAEQSALVEFDAMVKYGIKSATIQAEAFQVAAQQLVACNTGGIFIRDTRAQLDTVLVSEPFVKFFCVQALRDLVDFVGKNLSTVITAPSQECHTKLIHAEREQLKDVDGLQAQLTHVKTQLSLGYFKLHSKGKPTGVPFQGRHVATLCDLPPNTGDVMTFVMNSSGTTVAFVNRRDRNTVKILSILPNKVVTPITCTFLDVVKIRSIDALLFSPTENSLLVAEHGRGNICELTLQGECMRYIGNDCRVDRNTVLIFDCNAEFVVTCACVSHKSVINVFDYRTGQSRKQFDATSQKFRLRITGLKLTPDGSCVAVTSEIDKSIFFFTLDGKYVRQFETCSTFPERVCFLASGDIVVRSSGMRDGNIFVYTASGELRQELTVPLSKNVCNWNANMWTLGDFLCIAFWAPVAESSKFTDVSELSVAVYC